MPKIAYRSMRWSKNKLDLIEKVKTILRENAKYKLTLRQIYYKMFAKDWFPEKWADKATGSTNNKGSYAKLGRLIADARLCGVLDWHSITDITRELGGNPHWDNPSDIIQSSAYSYRIDLWEGQEYRPEIWVEKDAMENVVSVAARENDVPFFSCRGYTSLDAIWNQAQRLKETAIDGYKPVILHFGDHDPSGIDMSRDIQDRVREFMDGYGDDLIFERMALNMNQVEQYKMPENPAKITDPRAKQYLQLFGNHSWELDALDGPVVEAMITERVTFYRNDELYDERLALQEKGKGLIRLTADNWPKVARYVENNFGK